MGNIKSPLSFSNTACHSRENFPCHICPILSSPFPIHFLSVLQVEKPDSNPFVSIAIFNLETNKVTYNSIHSPPCPISSLFYYRWLYPIDERDYNKGTMGWPAMLLNQCHQWWVISNMLSAHREHKGHRATRECA